MNAKIYLTGIVGGILCSAALGVPLTEYLPSTFINDWGAVNTNLSWGLVLLTCVIILACGAIAARLSGTKSRAGACISGAVSGWIAAMISYILVGGAAAGVWGASPILKFGLRPAARDAQFIQLLVDGITGIHWWTVLALWGAMLLGLGLGALGGLLAGAAGNPDPDMALVYQVTAVSGMLTGGLVMIINTVTLTTLSQITAQAAIKTNLIPAYSTTAMLVFPVITTFLMMLGCLSLWWFFYRWGQAAGQVMDLQVRLSAAVLFGTPVLTLIAVFLFYRDTMFYTLYLPFFVLTILSGWLIMRHVWMNSTSAWNNTVTFRIGMFSMGLSFLVMAIGVYCSALPAALSDVLLVISSISTLTPGSSEMPLTANMAELVRIHYTAYRSIGLLLMLTLALFSFIISALVLWLMQFFGRRSLQVLSQDAQSESTP